MVVQQGLSEIEARLVAAGFTGGVHTLVERWRQHRSALAGSSLTWEYDDAGLYPPRHQAGHDHGIFVVDATGYRDEWVLKHEWSGWGWRELGNGDARELKTKALQLLRLGGPFGGASELFRGRSDPKTCSPSGMMRHASVDGELRVGELVPGLPALIRVRPDGTIALRTLSTADLAHAEPTKLAAGLGEVEVLELAQQRVPWTFTDVWPLLGTIRTSAFDLLSCWLAPDEVAIIAARDGPHAVLVGTWAEVRALDMNRWLKNLPDKPLVPAVLPPPPGVPPTSATTATPRRVRVPAPAGPSSPPLARVEPLQAIRLPAMLADALAAYFAVVEGELPVRQTGAEFVRELVWALVRAAIAGATTTTGAPAELLAGLHRQGHLLTVPSDQVGRDALKILASHTPLVRRIHYRRWRLAFGDLLDPESELRMALRRFEPT